MGIIVISRGSYSYGANIAQKVAKTLNYESVSREKIIEASAKEFNVPEVKLLHAVNDAPSFLERITHGRKRYIAYIKAAVLEFVNYSALTDGASGRGLFPHPEDPHGDSCFSEG